MMFFASLWLKFAYLTAHDDIISWLGFCRNLTADIAEFYSDTCAPANLDNEEHQSNDEDKNTQRDWTHQ